MMTLGLSTWSLHRTLESNALTLLDLPAEMRKHGLTDLQICHFHLPSRDPAYLADLKNRMAAAGVTCDALLLDFGDLTDPTQGPADEQELMSWLETGAALGARHARIAAGKAPPSDELLQRSADALLRLAARGRELGIRVITENWLDLLPGSEQVLKLMKLTQGQVPLCLDFGNWSGPRKYQELAAIAPDAVTVHAKCVFSAPGAADETDFRRCLNLLPDSDFEGTIALIYDGPSPDEWAGLDQERDIARSQLGLT